MVDPYKVQSKPRVYPQQNNDIPKLLLHVWCWPARILAFSVIRVIPYSHEFMVCYYV